jgi:hypothetical protein
MYVHEEGRLCGCANSSCVNPGEIFTLRLARGRPYKAGALAPNPSAEQASGLLHLSAPPLRGVEWPLTPPMTSSGGSDDHPCTFHSSFATGCAIARIPSTHRSGRRSSHGFRKVGLKPSGRASALIYMLRSIWQSGYGTQPCPGKAPHPPAPDGRRAAAEDRQHAQADGQPTHVRGRSPPAHFGETLHCVTVPPSPRFQVAG